MMKIKVLFAAIAFSLTASIAFAQTGAQSGTAFGSGEDSIRCRQNISLFTQYAKTENYKDAYEFWKIVHDECPASTKNIYIYGNRIYEWLIQNESDATKKAQYVDQLLSLYDDRAKYFGDDPKFGEDYIVSSKIADYMKYKAASIDYNSIYSWVKPLVDKSGKATSPMVLYYFSFASLNKAIQDKNWHDNYINDYMFVAEAFDDQIAKADDASKAELQPLKQQTDELFAQSGLADCTTLNKLYGDKLDAHQSDAKFLRTMMELYRVSDCESNPLFFKASKYLFAVEPSATAAMGLAKEAMDTKRWSEANEYLLKAIELSTNAKDRAACYYTLGALSMQQGSYGTARNYCYKALEEDPNMGDALILVAQMYAASANNIFPDDGTKARCVYFLAVDKLERARSIDPSSAAKANRLIGQYRQYFPSPADIFMHPELEAGKSFYVGGWIGESTTIRK